MNSQNEASESGSNSKALLLGGTLALAVIAAFVVFSSTGQEEEPESSVVSKAKASAAAANPPGGTLVIPEEGEVLQKPHDYKIIAKVWSKTCKGKKCSEPKRIDAKVSVRDKFGEVASYTSKSTAFATIRMPSGKYALVALDNTGNESQAKPVTVPNSGSGTIAADLTVIKK